jgi:hypothetical protein
MTDTELAGLHVIGIELELGETPPAPLLSLTSIQDSHVHAPLLVMNVSLSSHRHNLNIRGFSPRFFGFRLTFFVKLTKLSEEKLKTFYEIRRRTCKYGIKP